MTTSGARQMPKSCADSSTSQLMVMQLPATCGLMVPGHPIIPTETYELFTVCTHIMHIYIGMVNIISLHMCVRFSKPESLQNGGS